MYDQQAEEAREILYEEAIEHAKKLMITNPEKAYKLLAAAESGDWEEVSSLMED